MSLTIISFVSLSIKQIVDRIMETFKYEIFFPISALLFTLLISLNPACATELQVVGKITKTEGHVIPNCRTLFLKRNDTGAELTFRLENYTSETSIPSIAIAALTTGLDVMVDYDPTSSSGCGSEPTIVYIQLRAVGH
jgi:hypothetical protein